MQSTADARDIAEIRALIARQFAALSWSAERPADWAAFGADFHASAVLFASARPAQAQSPRAFVERMQGLAGSALQSFDERVLGSDVRVFGNVALAAVACETIENGTEVNRNVEMLLLVKDGDRWRIAAQAWDKADRDRPVPPDLGG